MKNVQLRLSDEVHQQIVEAAAGRPLADLIRRALEYYLIVGQYAREGRRLFYEDANGQRVEVRIPGII